MLMCLASESARLISGTRAGRRIFGPGKYGVTVVQRNEVEIPTDGMALIRYRCIVGVSDIFRDVKSEHVGAREIFTLADHTSCLVIVSARLQ